MRETADEENPSKIPRKLKSIEFAKEQCGIRTKNDS
jgi:hypothetical protein